MVWLFVIVLFLGFDMFIERELDVFRLVVCGLFNSEIAASLYLGEVMVKMYFGRVLMKLGVRDRV